MSYGPASAADEAAHRNYLDWKADQESIEAREQAARLENRLLQIEDDILQLKKWVLNHRERFAANE